MVAPTMGREVGLWVREKGVFRNAKHRFAIHAFDKTQFTKTLFSIHDRRSIHSLRRNSLKKYTFDKRCYRATNTPFYCNDFLTIMEKTV